MRVELLLDMPMLERDIENLIAEFPDEFIPGHSLVLKGRQQAFAGIGRFDLLFTDRYKTNVLVELKAVTAKYENATQLAKYKEALEAQGERNILMWLVAPHIPHSVREFLDRIGIEYSEIHEVQLRRVAERHGITIESPPQEVLLPRVRGAERVHKQRAPGGGTIDAYQLLASIDKQQVSALISEFEGAVRRRIDRSLAEKLREQILEAKAPSLDHTTIQQLARWCKTENPIYRDGMAVAQKISAALFGVVLDRERLGT
jgi:hypothetical protein